MIMTLSGAGAMAATDMAEFMIPSDPGVQVYAREKHLAGAETFASDRILLFVHGATYPAETSFDLPVGGASAMDMLAARGWDVWLVDVRGYSKSTRPASMDGPSTEGTPVASTAEAARDVGAAVDFILKRRGVRQINLMGWSWGTSIMGLYTTTHNDKVARLVLYAPQWLSTIRTPAGAPPLGAYRTVTRGATLERWMKDVPEDKKATLIPPGWFDMWADATFATDPHGAAQTPAVLRAPNGTAQDNRDYWWVNKPLYQPSDIRVPTLIIHAEWDADLPTYQASAYFEQLTRTPYKRFVQLGEGTHTVMLEKNRMQFIHEVAAFLEEPTPQALN
ncbi:alpha/beta hydrolase [Beijerinckia sp. L45]|uniref:alpha/beta hydrolase n=1 Tax=Beijerinckia sp. L45 TaxID=1641855 RepID=UPI001FEDE2D8|nr:alpha/beta fold hydrolase [Beijerinckia sp. L45]